MLAEQIYQIDLPWPPSLNTYRSCCKNRLVTVKRGRDYFEQVAWEVKKARLHDKQIDQPVLISLIMHPPSKRRFDCSNFLKAYEDALVKSGLLEDDHWIEYDEIRKGEVVKGGLLKVKINVLECQS